MKDIVIPVEEIPMEVEFNTTLEIISNNVSYFTHGFFKYPCKFIPHIPKWAILKYTKPKNKVLDPFAGSGTTLVEAVLHQRDALGIDFDKLSQLLCKVKTLNFSDKQIKSLNKIRNELFTNKVQNITFEPDLHNINHWFPKDNISELLSLREKINDIYTRTRNEKIYNFLQVCFASIIKKCSYADDTSPKPYVSSRFRKQPLAVKEAFLKNFDSYLKNIELYKTSKLGKSIIIAEDARDINVPKYNNKVSLAVTSPPYINAFDYVRSLRLENAWLGYYGDSNIINIKKKQVGTEIIPHSLYSKDIKETGNPKLDLIINQITKKDKKRAFVVLQFFGDMSKNIEEVKRLLKAKAHYIIVVGDSKIRGVDVPTHEILIDIAKQKKFELDNVFSYIIKNRYLRIPRSGRGGLIKKDWVIDLVKNNG